VRTTLKAGADTVEHDFDRLLAWRAGAGAVVVAAAGVVASFGGSAGGAGVGVGSGVRRGSSSLKRSRN
jgi:hypothetical protein